MADPLSVASGVAGLVGLAIQATQLTCRYVAEVNRAGEAALQFLTSLSLLRDVLERMSESHDDLDLHSITKRHPDILVYDKFEKCKASLEKVRKKLEALFREDGTIRKRKALIWPFQSSETASLITQLQDFRDTFAATLTAESLDVSVKSYRLVNEMRDDVSNINSSLAHIAMTKEAEKVLNTILPEDMPQWRFGNDKVSPVGSGSWFFDCTEYQDWLGSNGGILWCHGAPGSGKSVLMRQVISRLQQDKTVVCSHFCDHRDPRSQDPELCMRHLVRQVAMQLDTVLQHIQSISVYQEAKRDGRDLRKADILSILLGVCDIVPHVVIVIDGLDECSDESNGSNSRGEITQFLETVASKGARVMVASRQLADIGTGLGQCSRVTVQTTEADLRAYVAQRLDGIERRIPQALKLKDDIIGKVVTEANGLFLLARLMIDLLAPHSIKNLRQIKTFLGKSCWNLSEMYQSTLDRIMASDAASSELAQRMLTWLCYASRPLSEAELQHAIATEVDDEDFDPDGITPGELLRASCLGIVICDERGLYSLFHLTAYEFLRNSPELNMKAAHLLIAKTCISYLSFASLGPQGPCANIAALEVRKQEYSLLDYAAKHWADHARQVEETIVDTIMPFVSNDVIRQSLGQAFYHRERKDADLRHELFESLPSGSSALHVACGRGLVLTAARLLQDGADPKEADNQGWTPLIAASSYCHIESVRLLLTHANVASKRVDIDQADREGWTPLFWAILKGHYSIVECLLAAGASVTVSDRARMTATDWGVFRSETTFVELLQRYSSHVSVKISPNISATEQRRLDMSSNGYSPQAYPSNIHHSFETPSSNFLAAATGNRKAVNATSHPHDSPQASEPEEDAKAIMMSRGLYRMLTKSARIHQTIELPELPDFIASKDLSTKYLELAIMSRQLTMVKVLIELGASLGLTDGETGSRTPLHVAVCCGDSKICRYLLSVGADPSLRDSEGHSPIDLALALGALVCMQLILESDSSLPIALRGNIIADVVRSLDSSHSVRSRKYLARNDEHFVSVVPLVDRQETKTTKAIEIVRTLLSRGFDVNAGTDTSLDTPLHIACAQSRLGLVQFLLAGGADVHRTNKEGNTALLVACFSHTASKPGIEVVEVLVQAGADVNKMDNEGTKTPLAHAIDSEDWEVVELLRKYGAEERRG
jgi:ankyrin repeat protein/uridine kinase